MAILPLSNRRVRKNNQHNLPLQKNRSVRIGEDQTMLRASLAIITTLLCFQPVAGEGLEAGAAKVEVTPPIGFPMWGYSSRRDKPSEGVLDPLFARAIVLKTKEAKIALVSLDLGRPPTR